MLYEPASDLCECTSQSFGFRRINGYLDETEIITVQNRVTLLLKGYKSPRLECVLSVILTWHRLSQAVNSRIRPCP